MATARPVELLQVTDTHLLADAGARLLEMDTSSSLASVLDAAATGRAPDTILVTGDLAHDEAPATYRHLRTLISQRFTAPIRWTPGNHDDADVLAAQSPGCELAEEAYVDARWAVLMLSSHIPGEAGGRLGPACLERLRERLEQHRERHVLLALHHPPVDVGAPWLDAIRLADGDQLGACLSAYSHVQGIVCGHVHQRYDGWLGAVPVWTTPSTCFQFQPTSERFTLDDRPPGWRRLRLEPDGRVVTVVERLPVGSA